MKGRQTGDGIVERDVDFHSLADKIFDILQFVKLIFGDDVFPVDSNHARHETAQWRNAIAFLEDVSTKDRKDQASRTYADPKNRRVNVGGLSRCSD